MLLQDRQRHDGAALPVDGDRPAGGQPVLAQDRRVFAAGRRFEAITEPGVHHFRVKLVEVNVNQLPALDEKRTQVVDAMGMVGVLVGVENAVEPIDVGVEKLLAQIGRGVHQHAREPLPSLPRLRGRGRLGVPLDQERGAPAPVLRVFRIAVTPAQSRPRHAAGRATAENGDFQGHAAGVFRRGT